MKYFKFNSSNTLHIGVKDRNKFIEDFANLQIAIRLSMTS